MNASLLLNSLVLASGAAVAALGLGLLAAIGLTCLPERLRRWALVCTAISLVVPPFIALNCWLDLLGPNGILNPWMPGCLNIYSFAGAVWTFTWLLWPVTCLSTVAVWNRINTDLMDCTPGMRGWLLLRGLLFPMARRSLAMAFAVTFVLALNNFAVPAILQVKVLPAEIWMEFNTTLNNWAAVGIGWPLILASVLLLGVVSRMADLQWPRSDTCISAALMRRQLGPLWHGIGLAFLGLAICGSLGAPLCELLLKPNTWREFLPALQAGSSAIWQSFYLSALAAAFAVALGMGVGALRFPQRIPDGLLLAAWIPFLVPGVLLGVVLIACFNHRITEFFYTSSWIMVLALVLRYFAPGFHGTIWAINSSDRDIVDAARINGAQGWNLLKEGLWPQISSQVVSSGYIVYLLCLWDVETLVLIQPPGGETTAIKIFNLLHYGHNDQVNALCVWLGILALAPWLMWSGYSLFWKRLSKFKDDSSIEG